jgi:hypothetical protein
MTFRNYFHAFGKLPSDYALVCLQVISVVALLGIYTSNGQAQGSKDTVSRSSTSSDSLTLKPEHGPWLIMAKSFTGSDAVKDAEQLALSLRKDFQLQAYVLNKKFDFTQPVAGAGIGMDGREKRMKYRDSRVVEGFAVVVGDFDAIDSPAMTEALDKVKRIVPKQLANGTEQIENTTNSVDVSSYRKYVRKFITKGDGATKETAPQGPMFSAFATRNPLLPADFYKAPELDKFVKKLNEQKGFNDHSLLDCPGKFTVRVAIFRGEDQTVSWGRSTSVESAEDKVSQLDIAAERASITTRALRRAGYEAYQFHDRTQSIVTIGSFNELGKTNQANQFVRDKGIQDIVERFGATKKVTRSQYGTTQTPTLLFDLVDQKTIPELNNKKDPKALSEWFAKYSVAFDLVPAPMAVPKMTASSIYGGSFLGKDRK